MEGGNYIILNVRLATLPFVCGVAATGATGCDRRLAHWRHRVTRLACFASLPRSQDCSRPRIAWINPRQSSNRNNGDLTVLDCGFSS